MDAPEVETEVAESAPRRKRGPWPLIAIVAALTLIAVWLVPGESPDSPDTDTAETKPAPSLLAPEADAPAEQEEAPETLVDDRPGARARALIAEMRAGGERDLDALFAAAESARRDGELPDAYLLYFFAAREGHADAALALGRQADPASHTAGESVFESPDLTQAHKWYQVAARNGSTAARDGLAALRARVERLAADGDPEAQRIALLWQ